MAAQTKAILLFACAAVLFSLVLVPGENVWNFLHNFLMGMFGDYAILWPLLLLYVAIITAMERKANGKIAGKLTLATLAIMFFSAVIYVFTTPMKPQNGFFTELGVLYANGIAGNGSGLLGGVLGVPAALLCGLSGAQIITVILLIVTIMFLFGITIKDLLKAVKKPVSAVKDNVAVAREQQLMRREQRVQRRKLMEEEALKKERARAKAPKKLPKTLTVDTATGEVLNDGDFNIDVPLDDDSEQVTDYGDRLKTLIHQMNTPVDINQQSKPVASKVADIISKKKKTQSQKDDENRPSDLSDVPIDAAEKVIAEEVNISLGNDKALQKQQESNYVFPPVELLHPTNSGDDDTKAMEELQTNGEKLITTLESFSVNAKIVNICRGPSVTRFELQPAPGVKISKITNLSDDIALNLAADGVRIEAPIPGKAAVGIEVPNRIVSMVSMRELIDSRKFNTSKSKLSVVLGKDISGNIVVADLGKMPHLLIAGTTGSGKSVCVNSILISLLYKASPEEVKLLLIDPKMVEFSKYKGIPHLLIPVVSDAKKAAGALNWAVNEMLQRYKTFSAYNVRDIYGYNKMIDKFNKIRENKTDKQLQDEPLVNEDNLPVPTEKMHSIVIAIDELADLMMAAPNEVEESICRLAQMARAAGMHLIIATQRPSVNVITGVIKANIPSRISLKVSSQIDSRTILDIGGAEKLIGRGDMLFAPVGSPKPLRVQGCYASDEEIENVTGYIKQSHKSDYNEQVVEEIEKIAATEINSNSKGSSGSSSAGEESDDPMMEEAIKLVVEAGQASTSLLQRRLRLGYARAGRLIDEMEQMGVVGPHEGSKAREVRITYQQWLERNNMTSE
ncbi:MAG TPA: DNA translocase FtsK [Clostridiales bacterium]|nr:DNA translocase FtsK [Clostridiales bacterium]